MSKRENCMHGLAAEFADAESLKAAAQKTRDAGYKEIKAYTPFYVAGLNEIIDDSPNFLPWLLIIGLLGGAFIGFMLQGLASVEGYAINVGGRALFSWQAFTPVAFEVGVLTAALFIVGGFFLRIGLPLPYHPIFNTPNIEMASSSRFFLCIQTQDQQFHTQKTREFLEQLEPLNVSEVAC